MSRNWAPDTYFQRYIQEIRPSLDFTHRQGDWENWQRQLRAKFSELLGLSRIRESHRSHNPSCVPGLQPVSLERKVLETHVRERIEITTLDGLRMPVYVLIPRTERKRLSVVIACHGHGYGSKDIVGLEADGSERRSDPGLHKDFAVRLVERGHLVLAPELLGFGDRRLMEDADKAPKENSCYRMAALLFLGGQTLAGHRVFETMRALDYALTRAEADPQRIGIMGISGGGLVAAFTAALDDRIRAAVVSCYANTFRASIVPRRHCLDNYVPGLLETAEMPDLLGLIAPRPLFLEAGIRDPLFPIDAAKEAYRRLTEIYGAAAARGHIDVDFFDGGHEISGGKSMAWLAQQLA